MPTTTISVTTEAHQRLKGLRQPGQSFSEVILEHLPPPPARTCAELLEQLTALEGEPIANPKRMKLVREGRGRRSTRRT